MTRRGESASETAEVSIEHLAEFVADRLARFPEGERPEAMARLFTLVGGTIFGNVAASPPRSPHRNAPSAVIPLNRTPGPQLDRLRSPALAVTPPGRRLADEVSLWTLRRVEQSLVSPDGTSVRLSGREFILLEVLSDSPGQQASRISIGRLFGYDDLNPSTRSLDSLVYRLRQKARAMDLTLPLTNIHAAGIRFTEPLRTA
ncbi:winged helix-turn-helix domain-containing protein [Bradyrhizobium sp.]|uniref:winged helix-turn-helix domain-containing protein n=1 Tax=Bradyrhizobium sp. TaxID=376 RepID=UPI0039E3F59C